RCEQDSNLRGGTPLDFKSNALTTRPSQHLYVPNVHSLKKSPFEKEFTKQLNANRASNHLNWLKLSAKRKLRCEQDSNLRGDTPLDFESNALTTRPSQRLTRIALDVLSVHHHVLFYHENSQKQSKYAIDAGFEPARGDPIGFQVQRLNHSTIAASPPD
ncbi:unnamed protein product, partial [Porites lobata]